MSLQKNGGWKERKPREQSSCSIEQPIRKQGGEKTIVKGLELNIFLFFQNKVGHVIHNPTRSVSYRSLCNPCFFSSLGQARFLLGASVPLTSSSLFLPPALSSPRGLIYTHTFPSFFLCVLFSLSLHISSQTILLHISTCFKLFSAFLQFYFASSLYLSTIHYTPPARSYRTASQPLFVRLISKLTPRL